MGRMKRTRRIENIQQILYLFEKVVYQNVYPNVRIICNMPVSACVWIGFKYLRPNEEAAYPLLGGHKFYYVSHSTAIVFTTRHILPHIYVWCVSCTLHIAYANISLSCTFLMSLLCLCVVVFRMLRTRWVIAFAQYCTTNKQTSKL